MNDKVIQGVKLENRDKSSALNKIECSQEASYSMTFKLYYILFRLNPAPSF